MEILKESGSLREICRTRSRREFTQHKISDDCRATLTKLGIKERRLLDAISRLAILHGLPEQIGIMLLEGIKPSVPQKQFHVDQFRVARFRQALKGINLCEAGLTDNAAMQPSMYFSTIEAEMRKIRTRNLHRKEVLAVEQGKAIDAIAKRSLTWCRRYDEAWLDTLRNVPDRGGRIRTEYRDAIVCAIKNGGRTRGAIRKIEPAALDWCEANDEKWLDATMPVTRYENLSFEERRTRCRRMITIALEAGITTRANMPKRAKRWCLKNDREWLERTVPTQLSYRKNPMDG